MLILKSCLILLSIILVVILSGILIGRYSKKKYLPLTKVDMDERQYNYVMKRLRFQKSFSKPALLFYIAIEKKQLQKEDLPNLTKYLQDSGAYIGKYKLY